MKNFLQDTLTFQSIFGVNESYDFITGRDYNKKQQENFTENQPIKRNKVDINKILQFDNFNFNEGKNTEQRAEDININNFENKLKNNKEIDKIETPKCDLSKVKTFEELCEKIKNFNGCNLKRHSHNDVIFDGNKNAKIMLIGEAPGEEEDLAGKPFCGDSGQLLRKALNCIKLNEENMLITNTIYWRPPDNRKPYEEEIEICKPFLKKMIEIVRPKILILCGQTSTNTIINENLKISDIAGKIKNIKFKLDSEEYEIKIFSLYHPAYLLRVPSKKKIFWEHLLILQEEIKNL